MEKKYLNADKTCLSYCKAVYKNIVIGSHKRFLIVAHISITDRI